MNRAPLLFLGLVPAIAWAQGAPIQAPPQLPTPEVFAATLSVSYGSLSQQLSAAISQYQALYAEYQKLKQAGPPAMDKPGADKAGEKP